MNKVETFTSTGSKLINHPIAVNRIIRTNRGTPISIQIAPTSRCNLNCVFCSNAKRDKHEDLDLSVIKNILSILRYDGLKTVEWTGGGDPTQYKHINEAIKVAASLGLQQGFISNGVQVISKLFPDSLAHLHWMRISMNCLDYVDDIVLPNFNGTLGFSYVMNEKSDLAIFKRLDFYIKKYKPAYVRVVPNCQATYEEQERNNERYASFVEKLGEPYFYQVKSFEKPDNCWWGHFKPFLLHNGWIYPCSSVVLNDSAEKQFHDKFKWVHVDDLPKIYEKSMQSFDTRNCTHCVFTNQNNEVENLINPSGMENFI